MGIPPTVGQIGQEGQAKVVAGRSERDLRGRTLHDAALVLVGLYEDRIAAAVELDRPRVAEPAHAPQHAEVVVEGAVLLHQYDDVANVFDRAGDGVGRNLQCLGNALGQRSRGEACGGDAAEERTAIDGRHEISPGASRLNTAARFFMP